MKNSSGFTLIEMMVLVTIIGIVVSILIFVASRISGYHRSYDDYDDYGSHRHYYRRTRIYHYHY